LKVKVKPGTASIPKAFRKTAILLAASLELIVEWNEWNGVLLLKNKHESGEGNSDQ